MFGHHHVSEAFTLVYVLPLVDVVVMNAMSDIPTARTGPALDVHEPYCCFDGGVEEELARSAKD